MKREGAKGAQRGGVVFSTPEFPKLFSFAD